MFNPNNKVKHIYIERGGIQEFIAKNAVQFCKYRLKNNICIKIVNIM